MKQWLQLCLLSLTLMFSGIASAATIDINKADSKTLQQLEGIGPKKAQAIINFRRKNGAFKSLSDLQKVPGIGEKTILKNKRKLSLRGGLSTSKTKASAKSSTKRQVKEKAKSTAKSKVQGKAKAKAEAKSRIKAKSKSSAKTKAKLKAKTKAKAKAKTKAKVKAKAKSKAAAKKTK